MGLHALVATAASGLVGAAAWVVHRLQTFNVAAQSWTCVECQGPNELDRDTCWSCGAGYGQDPLFPSPIPMERRWICMSCAVWNGVARRNCWRCGAIRNAEPGLNPSSGPPHKAT